MTHHGTVLLESVNVGLPEVIGSRRGAPVLSGIRKHPVPRTGWLSLSRTNLEGDGQADLSVHGGADKAVYALPAAHLPAWNRELSPPTPFAAGTFGENLTTAGWLETDVLIGDVWAWGDALLQVCQPRYPCFKLAIATGQPDIGKRLIRTGRCGWYLRVLQPGQVPCAGPVTLVERGDPDASVLAALRATLHDNDPEATARISRVAALAAAWRRMLHLDSGST